MKNKITFKYLILTVFATILLSACNDEWDNHYQPDASIVADGNLWEKIEAEPELSKFAEILKQYGYDKFLSYSQAYTVFAPINAVMDTLDLSQYDDVESELIKNHIGRFITSASGSAIQEIIMLNQKIIDLHSNGGVYYFGNAMFASPAKNIVASNGLIHVLDDCESFFPNIYEYFSKKSEFSLIKEYFYSFDQIVFDANSSVEGSVDPITGKMEYIDSVFINYNNLLSRYGYINREDSSYTMLVPTNTAWNEAYERIKKDYVYYNANQQKADSLQRIRTSRAIVQDLIFNNNLQISPLDSIISTSGNTFYNPQSTIFDNASKIETSNGVIYMTDLLNISPFDSWNKKIVTEAESTKGRENTLSTLQTYSVRGINEYNISGYFLHVIPSTASGNPTITFQIAGNLSAKYDIDVVFVPSSLIFNGTVFNPCKVYFEMKYMDALGATVTQRFPDGADVIQTNPYVMDTVNVATDFKFPVANYGEENASVTLQIFSNVKRAETANFSRDLLIDCIILKPKQ